MTHVPGLGFSFPELATREGLERLDAAFLDRFGGHDALLRDRLLAGRQDPGAFGARAESELIIALAPHLEDFLAELFAIEPEIAALRAATRARESVQSCQRLFVQRQAVRNYPGAAAFDGAALARDLAALLGSAPSEESFAAAVAAWEKEGNAAALDLAQRYVAWAALTPAGRAAHPGWVLFRVPRKLDPLHLIPITERPRQGVPAFGLDPAHWRSRDGFSLTDPGMSPNQALDQMHYCIWCHEQGKDSCSKGLLDRKSGGFAASVFGVRLAGCPLEERISEMHMLRAGGTLIGAFATIAIDNPMMAATGHRICNDCMKACIYQKQDPVDIPQAESAILREVLALPWGFEIYDLLTRWNPLNLRRPLPRPPSGRAVLVVGLGPAGFTLAHHLLNEGHTVVAIDGLKIEPLGRDPRAPVRDAAALFESLDDRVMVGFGGVAEYGITVRWNKNYLKLIRLMLERRASFAAFGGVRFGQSGTLSIDDAWALGFDHIALCSGAGRPTMLDIPGGLARGVRQASDFLMALQLTGAAKRSSLANLVLRLPVVVIGGGLTAIDTATEALAYYVREVEKFAARYRMLVAERGLGAVRAGWSEEENATADEFLAHAAAIAAEREAAAQEARAPALAALLDSWGGATIAYRRRLIDSPSYTLNHEEVAKAMEEGVRFAPELTPVGVECDRFGHAAAVRFKRPDRAEATLPARAVLIAAGTQPNTVLAREDGRLQIEGRYFRAIDAEGVPQHPEPGNPKPEKAQIFIHRAPDGRLISFFGDLHPSFAGNVVKAMASARRGYGLISAALATLAREPTPAAAMIARCRELLSPRVVAVERLTPRIVEVVVHAPAQVRAFRPGQFFRLQNYETLAPRLVEATGPTVLAMEGLAMTGASSDPRRGLVSVIALEMGGSSDLCTLLRQGEPVVLMGPTGSPSAIRAGGTVVLAGGGLGNAVLFSIGAALRAAGSRVLYFAGYKKLADRYKLAEIERAADVVVWCCDEAPGFAPGREQDRSLVGTIVEGIEAYGTGRLGRQMVPLIEADELIAIGSDEMMAAIAMARHGRLAPLLKPGHRAIGSINSPMQCMMKEICAQCLQPHFDPQTGERRVVFSCFNQDQPLDLVDFSALHERLGQNSLSEKLTALWIDRALRLMAARPKAAA